MHRTKIEEGGERKLEATSERGKWTQREMCWSWSTRRKNIRESNVYTSIDEHESGRHEDDHQRIYNKNI